MESLVVSALAGAAGANAGAVVLRELNLGLFGNTVTGIIAGLLVTLAGPWLGLAFASAGILQGMAASASVGAVTMAALGFAYNRMI